MRFWVVVLCAVFGFNAVAAAAGSPMRLIPHAAAPAQVRHDLFEDMSSCGASAKLVRSSAYVEVGPIGGGDRKDYIYLFADEYWQGSNAFIEQSYGSACTANYVWGRIWMSEPGGKYKSIPLKYPVLYFNDSRALLLERGFSGPCKTVQEQGWAAIGYLAVWSPRAEAFRPVTKCMTIDDADAWARAHGFKRP